MSKLARSILAIVVALYPLAVYFGVQYLSLTGLLLLLMLVALMRLLLSGGGEKVGAKAIAAALVVVCAFSWLRGDASGLLWYPVMINALMLGLFAWSLRYPPTVIERLARLQEPDLPDTAVTYTRRVTQVWCAFFIVNGVIATLTVLNGDMQVWTLYNGLLSYCLMAIVMGAEWAIRRYVRKRTAGGVSPR